MEDVRYARVQLMEAQAEELRLEASVLRAARDRPELQGGWSSGLPIVLLERILCLLLEEPALPAAAITAQRGRFRAVCATWCAVHDAHITSLKPLRKFPSVMKGKMGLFKNVTRLDLLQCDKRNFYTCGSEGYKDQDEQPCTPKRVGFQGQLDELRRMPSLISLAIPSFYAAQAEDAGALCALTRLKHLRIVECETEQEDGYPDEQHEWRLVLGKLTSLRRLEIKNCFWVVRTEATKSLGDLRKLKTLIIDNCCRFEISSQALRGLTSLTRLDLRGSHGIEWEQVEELKAAILSRTTINKHPPGATTHASAHA